jgi:hypothetical protein
MRGTPAASRLDRAGIKFLICITSLWRVAWPTDTLTAPDSQGPRICEHRDAHLRAHRGKLNSVSNALTKIDGKHLLRGKPAGILVGSELRRVPTLAEYEFTDYRAFSRRRSLSSGLRLRRSMAKISSTSGQMSRARPPYAARRQPDRWRCRCKKEFMENGRTLPRWNSSRQSACRLGCHVPVGRHDY